MTTKTKALGTELRDILIVEDNEDHLVLTVEALQDAGIQNPILAAATLRQARAHLDRYAHAASSDGCGLPCVILLDVRLPDGSGMELLREIKQHPVMRAVPVVVLTSSDVGPDVRDAYQLGANSYLVEPISFEDFHRKVREAGLYWAILNHSYSPGSGV